MRRLSDAGTAHSPQSGQAVASPVSIMAPVSQTGTDADEGSASRAAALETAGLGTFAWNLLTDELLIDERGREIFGFGPSEGAWARELFGRVHPDDLAQVREAVQSCTEGLSRLDVSFRLRGDKGTARIVTVIGGAGHGSDGRVESIAGVLVDSTQTRRIGAASADSEERYRSFIAHSSEGIWLMEFDPPLDTSLPVEEQIDRAYRDGCFVDCNDAMARMYGLARAEDLIGRTLDFPLPASDPSARAYLEGIIRAGYAVTDVESAERDAAGNLKHFANSMIGVVENGWLKRLWGIQRDITDRKQAEEQRTLLIHELNHRVKNTLATVQSIASQTLRNARTMQEAKEAVEDRLIALARAHDVLTQESWEGAEIREIVAQALAPYANRDGCRLEMSGPPLRLSPRMALSLSMALQELATNAVKYGALSRARGRVDVAWSVRENGPSPRLSLHWEESGGPPVGQPTYRGFGSRLIERILARELNGQARIEFRPSGVVCTMDAPLARELPPLEPSGSSHSRETHGS
ncbi:PAS domain S-box-containing protein [Microvirga flocculans]|uniref:Blue-light-activated histidine kinase n=1 Tax=Microvirga flocculans TaxID=217168 RepID=A0A7W6IE54_9HYPH|nr:HWE histidine kinase domain-containing protein [Microvirga flocculans]MBB4039801.1 PAS domain S-box-containing protein [Microvirga flocculans]